MWISIVCIYIYIHIGIHISLYLMQTWEREKLGESYDAGNDMKCKVKVCNISGNGNKVRTPNHAFCTVTMTMTWIRYSSYSRTRNCRCELSESFRMIRLLMAGLLTRWWQLKDFYFHPENWGNDPILSNIFQMGWFKPPTSWALFDPTRFAKEVKEKCGVKAKAGNWGWQGWVPRWPVLVWFEDQFRFWRLREVIASSTNLSKLPAICSMFLFWWVSDWMFPNLKSFGWLFFRHLDSTKPPTIFRRSLGFFPKRL